MVSETVSVPADHLTLSGDFVVPDSSRATVLFVHGVHTSRQDPAARSVAAELHRAGFGTLAVDLFSETEGRRAEAMSEQRVDIGALGRRLIAAVDWLRIQPDARTLPVVLFAAGAEAAAALIAAAALPEEVLTVVSWAGQPELADEHLERVRVPVLFVEGGEDPEDLRSSRQAAERIAGPHTVREVRGASHRLREPGALSRAAAVVEEWFTEVHRPA
ncbi:hydrolase [Streptomyces sp. NTH33]|uniref:dienelactone hydrolase family protein n=1 Tax=Streptomyces sp. NTH33 TaxID=1735453 RepID=UPI000DAA9011|nr:dienelactone hydrolase family protein [Streptomyces sp. NTH33]PZH18687.1 hydrolase [Streptomyces sp. NTH33]